MLLNVTLLQILKVSQKRESSEINWIHFCRKGTAVYHAGVSLSTDCHRSGRFTRHAAVITSSGCSRGLIFRRDALHLWCTLNYTLHRRGTLHAVAATDLKKDRARRNGFQTRSFFFSSNRLWNTHQPLV
ncbi:hypothetical protein Q8A67_018063 [Cirrhinus molitorella]|uniref:Uncharacterized protein n=1 Tax=Cirrhinus molitorella TaxID=172907 RepID=A0AA88PC04_9TELE|nr:hypothetical protein Q8A67_018063 [Cirrhinus molitorella]